MTTIINDFDTNNFIRCYESGYSNQKLAKTFGIPSHKVRETIFFLRLKQPECRECGITPEICLARFTKGESKSSIAKSFGVNLSIVQDLLAYAGIPRLKSQAEGIKLRYSFMSDNARKEVTKKANNGNRGRANTIEQKLKRAKTNINNSSNISANEITFCNFLRENGINFIQQANIGIYNTDILVDNIAVEIFGGNWHAYGEHLARLGKRTSYILNNGINLYIIWAGGNISKDITINAFNDFIAFRQELSLNPSAFSKYRVVGGNGQLFATGSADEDYFSLIPSCIRANHPIRNNIGIGD